MRSFNPVELWGLFLSWITRFSYKPNFKFRAEHLPGNYFCLYVQVKTVDAYVEGAPVVLEFPFAISPDQFYEMDFKLFTFWMETAIREVEGHEFDEWFKVDRKIIRSPHANYRRLSDEKSPDR